MGPIYAGNATDHVQLVAAFLQKHRQHLFCVEEAALPALTGQRLRDELRSAAASAASWDQWEDEEWAALPTVAIDWLARRFAG